MCLHFHLWQQVARCRNVLIDGKTAVLGNRSYVDMLDGNIYLAVFEVLLPSLTLKVKESEPRYCAVGCR